jgi:hypothetical protein
MSEPNELPTLFPILKHLDKEIGDILEMRKASDSAWQEGAQEFLSHTSKLTAELRLRRQWVAMLLLMGGSNTEEGDFPECVAIGNDEDGFFASGVLLTKDWLLTSSDARAATRLFAGIDITGRPNCSDIQFHAENDLLALFKVKDCPVDVVAPLFPPQDGCFLVPGTPMEVVAFGNIDSGGGTFGRQRQASFIVEDAGDVRIYASSESGICTGDSGGPAFYGDAKKKPRMLLGIADSVIGDDCDLGGVFATLVGKLTWINQMTKLTFHAGKCPDLSDLREG